MEFFHHDVNFDWMGKTKYFVALSLSLLIIGAVSWIHRGGLDYGIDFKGGTLVYVRFASTPPVDKLRQGLVQQGLGDSVIQRISDIGTANANEVVIYLPQRGQGNEALDAGKSSILTALHATLGSSGEAGKQDFNEATPESIADVLTRKDPLSLGPAGAARYQQLARQLTDYRDHQAQGVVSNLDQLRQAGATPRFCLHLGDSFYAGPFAVVNVEIVGPKVGADLRRQAVYVTLYALWQECWIYIALRFGWYRCRSRPGRLP